MDTSRNSVVKVCERVVHAALNLAQKLSMFHEEFQKCEPANSASIQKEIDHLNFMIDRFNKKFPGIYEDVVRSLRAGKDD
jgi:hypothetical protein